MTYRSHPAYLASAFLHGTIMVAVLVLVYLGARKRAEEAPPIFELVAGDGDNYGATEAPAQGVPGEIKIEVPAIPRPEPTPTIAPPEPEPVIQPAPEPVAKAAPAITTPTIPNMARNIERLADKREANIRKQVEQKQKADAAAAAAKQKAEELAQKRLTKEEFDRLNASKNRAVKAPAPQGPIATRKIDAEGIAKGVVGGSSANTKGGAGGTAMSRMEGDLIDAYAALIVQRIRRALERATFSDVAEVKVQFQVSAAGVISGAKIVESSGNAEFDQAILTALRTIMPVGPTPTRKTETFVIPIRLRER